MARDTSKGMHWIGHPGSLHPVTDYGMEDVSSDIDVRVSTSMGGGRRVRVSRVRPPRSWSLRIPSAHADDIAHVQVLLTATLPPYQLVTADAQVSNVLTPERSVMRSLLTGSLARAGGWPIVAVGGAWTTITGLNPAAAGGANGLVRIGPCPTPPLWTNRPVTVSVWLATASSSGAYVALEWLDAAGAAVAGTVNGNAVTGMDGLRRSTATGTPPWGAVSCRLGIWRAEVISQPQVTWTPSPIPEWAPGRGADRVVITGASRDTNLAVPDSYALRHGDFNLFLSEVGPL